MSLRRPWLGLATLVALALAAAGAAAAERLPIFDTHVHYSRDAWAGRDAPTIIALLRAAGVPRALVSSSPDEGTLALYAEDGDRVVPMLRPYRAGVGPDNWHRDAGTPGYLAERLERGIYRGIGEFHLFDEAAAATPEMRQVAAMATARDIFLHVHSGPGPVEALFAIEPNARILWAHAGLSTPPETVGALLDRHQRLWADLSFRDAEIAPAGRLAPAWRAVLLRHADRFTVGSDTYRPFRWDDYGGIIDGHRRWLSLLPQDVAAAIAYGNAVRLFGAGPGDPFPGE